jgi:predicted unusual protein kinase regulating ubiquinone biosynthesis (AarF/ABC1/UbiB family)
MNKNKINLIFNILIYTFLVSACSFQKTIIETKKNNQSRVIANSNLENLIDEFKSYVDGNLSLERKQEIRIVQENLLKYLIDATESSEANKIKIYRDASHYFNRIYPLVLQNIKNEKLGIKEFNVIKSAPLWSLKEELRYLNSVADALPGTKVKIDLIEGLTLFSEIYKNVDAEQGARMGANYETTVQKFMGREFNLHPSFSELEVLLEGSGTEEQKILKVINLVDSKISKHETRIRNIGAEIVKSGQVDLSNPQIKTVVTFMDYYFKKLPSDVVKTIMSELVSGGAKLTEEEVMKIVFQNTGPGLGKVLQQIGKEKGIGPEFSKLTTILESSGKEVPYHLVKEVVDSDVGGFEVRSIEPKSVGTGTIAQVNKAKIWFNDTETDVALRFLKPGVAVRCKEDIAILRQFVPDHEALFAEQGMEDLKMMTTMIDSVEKFLNEEVDLSVAVERQKKAFEVYNRTVKVSADKFDMIEMRVPEVYLPPRGKSNLHVQEFAAGGVTFANLKDNVVKKAVAQEMVRMWFEEALFRSGFLNADLHQGNFRIVLVEENNKIKILLYDFGLSSTLSKEEQRAFLLVGAGAYMKSPKTLTDGLMVSMNSVDPTLRAKLLKDIKAEMKANPTKMPEDWIVWCVQKNYFVSDNLGALARGSLLLKQLPESIGQSEMLKDTIIKTAFANLGHAMADRDYDYPLTKIDMIKLSYAQSKSYCSDLIMKFFGK